MTACLGVMSMNALAGNIAVGVVIAVVSAYVTVRLALKRFRAE